MINEVTMENLKTLFGKKYSDGDFLAMDWLVYDPNSNDILNKVIAKDLIKRYNNAIDWNCARRIVSGIRERDKVEILFEIMDKDEEISKSLFEIVKLKRESIIVNDNLNRALQALTGEEE